MSDVSVSIEIDPIHDAGQYSLRGLADLPDNTRLAVAAIRYLRPMQTRSLRQSSNLTYSILDYREVEVSQGAWDVALTLWRVAPDGRYQEDWQLQGERLGVEFEPADEVVFVAMPAPITALPQLEQQLRRQRSRFASEIVRFTIEGERYVQMSVAETIALPTGQTNPPGLKPQDINDGWGKRYVLYPEPPTEVELEMPENRRTDAPASLEEFLR